MPQSKTKDTVCKTCIFAEWDDITQTGCILGKIEDFRKHNVPIMECYDDEKQFYVIPSRSCPYFRDDTWVHKDLPLSDKMGKMEKEIQIRFQAIVVADKRDSTEGLFSTLDSLYAQELKPVHIAVVRPPECLLKPRPIVEYFQAKGGRWKIQNILDIEFLTSKYEDLIVDFVKDTHMYSVFRAGTVVPSDFFSTINYKVHHEHFNFAALLPNSEGSGWTIPRSIYVYFMGNKQLTLKEKLEGYECPMYPVTEIVPSFPK